LFVYVALTLHKNYAMQNHRVWELFILDAHTLWKGWLRVIISMSVLTLALCARLSWLLVGF